MKPPAEAKVKVNIKFAEIEGDANTVGAALDAVINVFFPKQPAAAEQEEPLDGGTVA